MATPTINFAGFVFDDSGSAVSGATVHIYEKNTSTTAQESSSITTNSSGYWSYSHATPGEFDVEVVKGTSKRRFMFDDKLHLAEIDVEKLSIRGNEGAIAGLYMYADDGDDVSDQWLIDVGTDGVLAFGNDANSQGVFVDHVTFTPNSTVASSTVAFLGNVTVAAALTSATIDATTDFTIGTTVITDDSIVMTPSANDTVTIAGATNGILNITTVDANSTAADVNIDADGEIVIDAADAAGSIFKIAGTAQLSIIDGSILPTTDNDIDLGSSSYQFKDAYINGTLEADAITIGGTNVVTGSLITTLGTISAGVWQGTAIASGYIAADAITGAKIADDAIDSEHYTNTSIDFAHIQNVAANSILGRNANSSGVLSEVALATTQILIGDGTGFTAAALSGDATMSNAGVVSLAAAQTSITSMYATGLILGQDAQTAIDFGTSNEIDFKVDNAARLTLTTGALYPVTDNQIDLGTSSLEFKDAFFDGTVTADAFAGPLTGNVTGNASGTAATVTTAAQTNITSLGTLTTLTVDNIIINGTNIGHTSDTDAIAISSGGVVTMDQIPVFSAGINVSGGTIAGTLATAAQGNVTSLGTLTALTVDDVAINGKVMTMTGDTNDTAVFTAGTNGTLSIVTTDAGGTSGNIQITADGTAELAGTTVTLDSAGAIALDATSDVTIPADVGLTFGTGEKIEGDSTDLTITCGSDLKLTVTDYVGIGTGSIATTPGYKLVVHEDRQSWMSWWENDGDDTPSGLKIIFPNVDNDAANLGSLNYVSFQNNNPSGSTSVMMNIYGNGNIQNLNNSYGSLSDVNLKQNITDARDYTNDFKNVRFRKFRLKSNPSGPYQLGVIAQEIDDVFPSLVYDGIATSDADNVTYKGMKYSVLNIIAMKVLQSLIARVEALEA